MDLGKMIRLAIAFVVFVILITIARYAVLPPLKVGIPALPPVQIMDTAFQTFMSICQQFMGYIIIVLIIIWLLYKIISKIPLIGKIIIKKIPVFSACKNSGIFGLFDNIFGIIFSRATIPDRFMRFGRAVTDFTKSSVTYLAKTSNDMLPIFDSKSVDKTKPKPVKTTDPSFIPSDNDYLQDQLQMCLEENIIQVTPDMTDADKKYVALQNQSTLTLCKTKQLRVIMDNMSWKLPS